MAAVRLFEAIYVRLPPSPLSLPHCAISLLNERQMKTPYECLSARRLSQLKSA